MDNSPNCVTDHDTLLKIHERVTEIHQNYVTKKEFVPVKNFVYGMIGFLTLSIGGALISLILKR